MSRHYLGSIIGKKGAIKVRIERDTRTEIKIPRQGHDGDIVILGPSEANVKAARRRINMIVMSSRFKQKATHFISIPMNTSAVMESFNKFKESVLKDSSDRGLEESLFIQPWKLHLTLGTMCLMDNEERIFASKLLTEARDKIILLKGLQYMNDDPKEIDVLYGLVKEENAPPGILQKLSDEIVEYFYRAGLMQKEYNRDNLKLHVTLINSKYRSRSKKQDEFQSSPKKERETFDGSRILQQFEDYDFGGRSGNLSGANRKNNSPAWSGHSFAPPRLYVLCLGTGGTGLITALVKKERNIDTSDITGPDLPYDFLGFNPGPREFKGPPAKPNGHAIVLFADDTSLLFKTNRQQPAFDEVNSTICEAVERFGINNLLNERKTKLVQFSLTSVKPVHGNVMVKNEILDIVDMTLFLGLTLDAKLRWNSHIIRLTKSLSSAAYAVKRTR
ncbi:Activating signal cointegrator 1 complex subunit 1 [Eumeta japonica]|uniref:Activating signal cointegrator 1 complex subunit 1 n=1 Tax=Eumeta variegata TaxID=151549 RepID=A0A4C1X8U4_EUMVA|nr:Activating signal cointegrator 1 complex subunit 1 [Eumeta japonica]